MCSGKPFFWLVSDFMQYVQEVLNPFLYTFSWFGLVSDFMQYVQEDLTAF